MVVTILFRWGSAKKIVHPAGITFKKFGGLAAKKIPITTKQLGIFILVKSIISDQYRFYFRFC